MRENLPMWGIKRSLLGLALVLSCTASKTPEAPSKAPEATTAQKAFDYGLILHDTKEQCRQSEPYVLELTKYILSFPFNAEELELAGSTLLMWSMSSERKFILYEQSVDLWGDPEDSKLLVFYMAALVQYTLTHPEQEGDEEGICIAAHQILADYIENPANQVEMTEPRKKLLAYKKQGRLREYCVELPPQTSQ